MRCRITLMLCTLLLASYSLHAQFPCFGGTSITSPSGEETLDLCQVGASSVIRFGTSTNSLPFAFVVVDEAGTIVYIDIENDIDFSDLPEETLQVYAFNFIGNITAEVGDSFAGATLADGCFALTDNFITVAGENAIEGGSVSTEDGATEAFTCPGDGMPDLIQFDSSGVDPGLSFTYVVTDENNVILGIPDGDVVDFEDAGGGTCRLWGLTYSGNITAMVGDNAATTQLTDNCFALSENFVTVYREQPEGGTVMAEDGSTELSICLGAGNEVIAFDSMGVGNSQFTYVVTDENNVIIAVPSGDAVDFSNIGTGVSRVWGLAYTGNITAAPGDTASAAPLTDDCFDLSDNFVTVEQQEANGGTVSTEEGETEVFACDIGDGQPDVFRFDSTGVSGPNFTYVVTDENNVILDLPASDSADFDQAPPGICRVWGLAYSGNVLAMVGDTASAVELTDGCFDLSDNFVTVNRGEPEGGTVSTEDGTTEVFTCPGDGVADIIRFDSMGVSGANFAYVITDDANVILELPGMDMADFEDAGTGTSRVWGLAYTGDITAMVGDTASAVDLTDGCFSLSENFITVYREQPDGGTVSTEDGATEVFTCPGDGIADIVRFDSSGVSNSNFTYVITDDANVILDVPGMDVADFEDAGTGTSRVWGLAYTGNITAMVGDTASAVPLTDECFDLSDNFITVYREQPEGGTVSTEMGMDTVNVCVGDGVPDIIRFDSAGVSNSNFTYVITDDANVILGVPGMDMADFEDAEGGVCRVWGLAYTGNITASPGDTASAVALTDACFDLSDNFIVVNRNEVNGGMVTAEDGATEVYTCPGDTIADLVFVDSMDTAGDNFTYVVTDENNVILGVPSSDTVDLSDAGEGIYRIWGLSYSGNIIAAAGDTASVVDLSDGCFDLSDNFITAFRDDPEGGTVMTESGADTVTTCVGDDLAQFIRFDSMGTSLSRYIYVVTDTNNVIIGTSEADSLNFENAGDSICRVWGLSYTGDITAAPGDTASIVPLTDDCFDLSDNFVTVIKDAVDGGELFVEVPVEADGQDTIYICPNDTLEDDVLPSIGSFVGDSTAILVSDSNNIVLQVIAGDFAALDFTDSTENVFRLWGVAYNGSLPFGVGDSITFDVVPGSCYDFSEDFRTIVIEEPDGGTVALEEGGTEAEILLGGTGSTSLRFDSSGVSNSYFVYVVTRSDSANTIVDVIESGDEFEFDNVGTYRVWGLAYTGFLADVQTALEPLSTDCFSLSENFVTVEVTTGFAPGGTNDPVQLRSWPNPASDVLTVRINTELTRTAGKPAVLQIISLTGNVLQTRPIDAGAQDVQLNINRLNAGTYWLRYQSERAVQTEQFIKE